MPVSGKSQDGRRLSKRIAVWVVTVTSPGLGEWGKEGQLKLGCPVTWEKGSGT